MAIIGLMALQDKNAKMTLMVAIYLWFAPFNVMLMIAPMTHADCINCNGQSGFNGHNSRNVCNGQNGCNFTMPVMPVMCVMTFLAVTSCLKGLDTLPVRRLQLCE